MDEKKLYTTDMIVIMVEKNNDTNAKTQVRFICITSKRIELESPGCSSFEGNFV